MPGILRVRGTIDLDQFWPDGDADADTSKVKVTVGKDSFAFAADGKTFKKTDVYFDAYCVGASKKKVVDAKDRITVRLQGVDAPELHYQAPALKKNPPVSDAKRKKFNLENKPKRRQYLAETGTVALCKKLAAFGKSPIKCEVISLIDRPFEVIDTYGRFVANIRVGKGYTTDVNVWLCAEAWVYPTFYSSMEVEEINAFLDTLPKARKKGRVWKHYSLNAAKFDPKLIYRPKGPIQAAKDKGDVLMPKLFRRQLAYRMQKKAAVFTGTFVDCLQKNKDACFELDEFLKQGPHSAPIRWLHEFMKGSKFSLTPEAIVFREKFSSLNDGKGKKIEKF